jgi:predicted nucleic acid-binding protein
MMTVHAALIDVVSVAFDTAPLIYFVERNPTRVDLMRTILQRVDRGELTGYTSTITLTEVLAQPLRTGNTELQIRYRTLLLSSANFNTVVIDRFIAETGADIRARYGLRTPDALQIATGIVLGCDAFITNDRAHTRVTELKVIVLDELTW